MEGCVRGPEHAPCSRGAGRGAETQGEEEVPGKTETQRRPRWGPRSTKDGDRQQGGWGPKSASELCVRVRAVEQRPLCFSVKPWGSVYSFWMAPGDAAKIGEHSGMRIQFPNRIISTLT